jgi:hypothetical protein
MIKPRNLGEIVRVCNLMFKFEKTRRNSDGCNYRYCLELSGDDRDRTGNLLVANQAIHHDAKPLRATMRLYRDGWAIQSSSCFPFEVRGRNAGPLAGILALGPGARLATLKSDRWLK